MKIIEVDKALDTFLNGFIMTVKRGELTKDKATQPIQTTNTEIRHINNILLKKIKIALALTS